VADATTTTTPARVDAMLRKVISPPTCHDVRSRAKLREGRARRHGGSANGVYSQSTVPGVRRRRKQPGTLDELASSETRWYEHFARSSVIRPSPTIASRSGA
jgi:hypothetical protein